MTDIQDINARIAAAEARRQQALQAERERVVQEQSARRQIADSQAEIADLEHKREAATFEERNKSARLVANTVEALGRDLVAALERYDVPAAVEISRTYNQAMIKLEQYNAETRNLLEPVRTILWRDAVQQARQRHPDKRDEHPVVRGEMDMFFRSALQQYEGQIPAPAGVRDRVAAWVQKAPDAQERRIRQGIGFSVTGTLF